VIHAFSEIYIPLYSDAAAAAAAAVAAAAESRHTAELLLNYCSM